MRSNIKSDKNGFTLVEVIIVIAILSVLSALVVPKIMGNVKDAKVQKEITDARMLADEINTYNAMAKINGTATIPDPLPDTGKVELTKEMLDSTYLELPDEDSFPDTSIVKIYIDSDGSTSIDY